VFGDRRLNDCLDRLAGSHLQASQALASGIHAVPDASSSFASTMAGYRFLRNARVTLPALARVLIEEVRPEVETACDQYALLVHDWSQLMYPNHQRKKDRVMLSSKHEPEGYEILAGLLVSDRDGLPLAPVSLELRASDGVHSTRSAKPHPAESPLDALQPVMEHLEREKFARPLVHVIDAEADSVGHYRDWSRAGLLFLVRADDRIVTCEGQEQRCSAIQQRLREQRAFHHTRVIRYRGKKAEQWVAEVPVQLTRAAQRNRPGVGDRSRIPGSPLSLRLVIVEVRDAENNVLATWYLLSNVPAEVEAARIALWYYWRWSIESFFKLLKTAGMNLESWQQTTAAAIARRLLVAGMACVTVWRLARSTHPQADRARRLLVRLSGRQMKRGRPFTLPAMLAGMWTLLAMLETLEHYSLDEIKQLAELCLPNYSTPPPER